MKLRADDEVREVYEAALGKVIDAVAAGLEGKPKARRDEATALLALLVGGVVLARAVRDARVSNDIALAVRKAAVALGGHR